MRLLGAGRKHLSSNLSEARRSIQDITVHKVDGADDSDDSADSNDVLVMSKKKIRPKANLSTANRNQEAYESSQRDEVADKEDYLKQLAPLINPYDEVKRSINYGNSSRKVHANSSHVTP